MSSIDEPKTCWTEANLPVGHGCRHGRLLSTLGVCITGCSRIVSAAFRTTVCVQAVCHCTVQTRGTQRQAVGFFFEGQTKLLAAHALDYMDIVCPRKQRNNIVWADSSLMSSSSPVHCFLKLLTDVSPGIKSCLPRSSDVLSPKLTLYTVCGSPSSVPNIGIAPAGLHLHIGCGRKGHLLSILGRRSVSHVFPSGERPV